MEGHGRGSEDSVGVNFSLIISYTIIHRTVVDIIRVSFEHYSFSNSCTYDTILIIHL